MLWYDDYDNGNDYQIMICQTKRPDLEPSRRNQTKPIDICHKKDKIDEKDGSLGDDDDDESL